MKLGEVKNIFSKYTNVKLIVDGKNAVFEGYWYNVPADFTDYIIDLIIPIRNPFNDSLGEASILIHHECEE